MRTDALEIDMGLNGYGYQRGRFIVCGKDHDGEIRLAITVRRWDALMTEHHGSFFAAAPAILRLATLRGEYQAVSNGTRTLALPDIDD